MHTFFLMLVTYSGRFIRLGGREERTFIYSRLINLAHSPTKGVGAFWNGTLRATFFRVQRECFAAGMVEKVRKSLDLRGGDHKGNIDDGVKEARHTAVFSVFYPKLAGHENITAPVLERICIMP